MRLRTRFAAICRNARAGVREELSSLAHPSAWSWRVALVFAVISGLAQMVYDAAYFEMSMVPWVAPTLGSIGVFLAVFAACGRLSRRRRLNPVQVILCYVVAGSARTLSVGIFAIFLDLTGSMDLVFRVTAGLLLSPALLIVIAGGVVRHDLHLAIVNELEDQRDRLVDVGQSMEDALARTEDEITVAVREAIAPALDRLDGALERVAADGSSQPAVAVLTDLIEEEVRPISHRLVSQPREAPGFVHHQSPQRRVRVPLPARVALADGIRPGYAAALFFSVVAPTVVRHSPFDVAVIWLSWSSAVSCLVLVVVRALLRPFRAPAVPAVVLVAGVHAVATILTVPFLQAGRVSLSGIQLMAGAQVGFVVGAMTMLAVVVDARRAATERELGRVVGEVNAAVEMMGRRARLARTRLAHVLHGGLQGALHAAAIRLNEAKRPDADLVQIIRSDIAEALERIEDSSSGGAELRHTLEEIVAIWSGHRTVTVSVAPECVSVLAGDRDADAATAQVVREAVNNAFRHGRARRVDIEICLIDQAEHSALTQRGVKVCVTDDGVGWRGDASQGLGTMTFDDLCTTWCHVDTGSGTQLVAIVSLLFRPHATPA